MKTKYICPACGTRTNSIRCPACGQDTEQTDDPERAERPCPVSDLCDCQEAAQACARGYSIFDHAQGAPGAR